MPKKISDQEWAEIKERWEADPRPKNTKAKDIAAEYNLHHNTIEVRARNEDWHHPSEDEAEQLEEIRSAVEEVAPEWMNVEDKAAMQARILELERELAAKDAKIETLRPDTDIHDRLFDSVEDVFEWYGEEALASIAMDEIAEVNKQRIKRGHPAMTSAEMQPSRERIEQEARKILAERRNAVGSGPFNRSLKMIAPSRTCGCNGYDDEMKPLPCYRHGNLVPIPFEPQVNNMKGSLYDATERYIKKGFKLTNPLICFAGPCNEPAAVDSRGKLLYGGYCSDRHRSATPAEANTDGTRTVLGTINRDSLAV